MPAPARLEVVAGNAAGTWLDVTDELLIGRHADGEGRLADDEEISRYHARVSVEGGQCMVEDLGSTNGTFVNGSRISAPQTLKQGDTINVGASTLVVRGLPAPEAAAPPSGPPAPAEGYATAKHATPVAAEPPPAPEPPPPPPPPPPAAPPPPPPAPEPPPPATVPPLSLRVEIDFAGNEALISLGDAAEPLRIVLESGVWRVA